MFQGISEVCAVGLLCGGERGLGVIRQIGLRLRWGLVAGLSGLEWGNMGKDRKGAVMRPCGPGIFWGKWVFIDRFRK